MDGTSWTVNVRVSHECAAPVRLHRDASELAGCLGRSLAVARTQQCTHDPQARLGTHLPADALVVVARDDMADLGTHAAFTLGSAR